MSLRYCYWSVADGPYADLIQKCVASARRSGVFKEFHIFTDRPIPGCECYDAMKIEKRHGLFKMIYLKAAISRLNFEYFIWIDADSRFLGNPRGVIESLRRAPMHVPLITNLSMLKNETRVCGISSEKYVAIMRQAGVNNDVYLGTSAFWIVHRDVIDRLCELAGHFREEAEKGDWHADVSASLSYGMQMLCGNPEVHRLTERANLWASDDVDHFSGAEPNAEPWEWEDLCGNKHWMRPAIVHLPRQKRFPQPSTSEIIDGAVLTPGIGSNVL